MIFGSGQLSRRRRRVVLIVAGSAGLAAAAAFYLAVEYIPAWYLPATLSDLDLPRVRRQSGQWADDVGDRMVQGQRFTVELTQRECNEFLAALPQIIPEAGRAWPEGVSRPAVQFHPAGFRFGALCRAAGWQAIVSTDLTVALSEGGDHLVFTLEKVRAGALAVPHGLLRRLVDPALAPLRAGEGGGGGVDALETGQARAAGNDAAGRSWAEALEDVPTLEALQSGVRVRNRFTWPNGQRRFRIAALEFRDGSVRITVEPW